VVKKGATFSHSVYLCGGMDDDNNCKARIIQFSNGKTMGEQMARALHKITLREDLTMDGNHYLLVRHTDKGFRQKHSRQPGRDNHMGI
jgi:hypothetical protein